MKPKNRIEPWMFLFPALLLYTCIVIVPVVWSLGYSFFQWKGIGAMKFIGLDNYARMFADKKMIVAIKNNLFYMVLGTGVQVFMGLLMATLLSSIRRGSNVMRVLYFIPCIISSMAICKIFNMLLSVQPQGLFAAVVSALGGKPIAVLSSYDFALTAVTLVDAYKFCGLYMVIFYSAFMSIDQEIIEAAYIDGCTWWQQYVHVRLPMIKPIFFTVIVILVNGTLKSFDVSYILTGGGPGTATELVATYMYKVAFNSTNFGYGSAISMFLLFESLIAVGIVRLISMSSEQKEMQ